MKIGRLVRQKRPLNKDGKSRDTAKCLVTDNNGVKTYVSLGLWGTAEAVEKYAQLVRRVEEGEGLLDLHKKEGLTLESVYAAYLDKVEKNADLERWEVNQTRRIIKHAIESAPNVQIDEFTLAVPAAILNHLANIALETHTRASSLEYKGRDRKGECRTLTTKRPWTACYVNKLMSIWKTIFHFGINQGIIPPELWQAVKEFPGIKSDDPRTAPERPPREAIDDETVIRTLAILTPTMADFIKVLRGSGARPSEICRLTVDVLDFLSNGIVEVNPKKHKLAHLGFNRHIVFGLQESNIIRARAQDKSAGGYIFSVRDHMRDLSRRINAGNYHRIGEEGLLQFSDGITVQSAANALRRAIRRYNKTHADNPIPNWTLYQLRHAAFSANSDKYGVDVASKIAGHTSPNMARIYDHSAKATAERIAAEKTKGWWEE